MCYASIKNKLIDVMSFGFSIGRTGEASIRGPGNVGEFCIHGGTRLETLLFSLSIQLNG